MNNVLTGLKPASVFEYFEAVSDIPRGSGNEKEISDYLVAFAKDRNLFVRQDKSLNVIIKKPATEGYVDVPPIILQGHMDMVCEKNFETVHDFEKDPIKLLVDGDNISAEGTTLGADNGLAVAYCLALLDSKDIPHPALEVIVTTDEEVGMNGALALDTSDLEGKYLINLDSEEEGELLVSCAGGLKASINLPINWTVIEDNNYSPMKVLIKGLKGGHSGVDVDQNRGNSNRLMGRLLYQLNSNMNIKLVDICGGSKDNAIPREAYVTILIKNDELSQLEDLINNCETEYKNELKTSDPGLSISLSNENNISIDKALVEETLDNLIFLLLNLPNGIQTMSSDIKGLVESSLNLGVLQMNADAIKLIFAVRSSVRSLKTLMRDQLKFFAEKCGAEFIITGEYPEWEFMKESKLRDLFSDTYKIMYNKEPLVKALHAGLECGVFAEKIDGIDMISIGPDMFDVHTPDERLNISSTKRTWEYLLEVLKESHRL